MKTTKNYYAIDCETGNKYAGKYTGKAFLWTLTEDGNKVFVDYTFINIIENCKGNYNILYSHNFSRFDFLFVIYEIRKLLTQTIDLNNIKENEYYIMGDFNKCVSFIFIYKGKKYKIIDSYLKIPKALSKMAEEIGLKKEEVRYDGSEDEIDKIIKINVNELKDDEYSNFIKYAKMDVIILIKYIIKFYNNDYHKMDFITASSEAFNDLKGAYKLHIKEYDGNYYKLSYKGGFTTFNEKYQDKGLKGNFIYIDINSSYPARCIKDKLPYAKAYSITDCCLMEVILNGKLKKGLIPIIPTRISGSKAIKLYSINRDFAKEFITEDDNQTNYSINIVNKRILVGQDELEGYKKFYDLEIDIIKQTYFETMDGYKNYMINIMNNKNNAKDKIERDYGKGIANSTTGKGGQSPYLDSVGLNKELPAICPYAAIRNDNYDGGVLEKNDLFIKDKLKFIPIISFITMKSRCALYEVIYNNVENFVYCDTDSVILYNADINKLTDLLDDKEIGKGKIEYQGDCNFKTLGAKQYIFYNNEIIKSAHAGGKLKQTFDNKNVLEYYKNGMIAISTRLVKLKEGGAYIEEFEKEINLRKEEKGKENH